MRRYAGIRDWLNRAPDQADALTALVLATWAQLDLWVVGGALTQVPGSKAETAPFLLLFTIPLAWRRRRPLAVLLVVMGSIALEAIVVGSSPEGAIVLFPTLISFYSVGAYADKAPAIFGLIFGLGAASVQTALDPNPELGSTAAVVLAVGFFYVVLGGGAWLAGRHVRSRRIHADRSERRARDLEQDQAALAKAAAEAERVRIARELHDVIAHSVSLMGVQAGAAERMVERDPDRVKASLRSIQATARESVDELRRLLSVLRADPDHAALAPQPGLESLEALVAATCEAGLPVELQVEGERGRVSAGLELSAYRLVQEALTNVRKHAPGAATRVLVRHVADGVELRIDNDPPAGSNGFSASGAPASDGHGLAGMRERVDLYRGELDAAPRSDGGFSVRARLPHGPNS